MDDRLLCRGKREDNGEWVIGCLTRQRHSPKDSKHTPPYHLQPVIDYEEKGVMLTSFVDPDTIGQCTGLKDKNGKLIFEGDIIICRERNIKGDVRWSEHSLQWVVWDLIFNIPAVLYGKGNVKALGKYNEVIGNIYENPELLEGKLKCN